MSKPTDSDDLKIELTLHDHLSEAIRESMEHLVEDHKLDLNMTGRDFDKLVELSLQMADELERLVLLRFVRFLRSLGKPVPEGWENW